VGPAVASRAGRCELHVHAHTFSNNFCCRGPFPAYYELRGRPINPREPAAALAHHDARQHPRVGIGSQFAVPMRSGARPRVRERRGVQAWLAPVVLLAIDDFGDGDGDREPPRFIFQLVPTVSREAPTSDAPAKDPLSGPSSSLALRSTSLRSRMRKERFSTTSPCFWPKY